MTQISMSSLHPGVKAWQTKTQPEKDRLMELIEEAGNGKLQTALPEQSEV